MSEVGEVKRKVAEFEAKGDLKKAIEELEKALAEFTTDGSLFNKLGDLYIKVNRKEDALDVYEKGARVFKEETYYPNAIALCKKILRLSKDRTGVYNLLGDLHKELDQTGEAVNFYLEYAERKIKENALEEALQAYNTIKELVPNNPKILETISAIYEKVGKKEEGEEFRKEAQEIETKQEKFRETLVTKEPEKVPAEEPKEKIVMTKEEIKEPVPEKKETIVPEVPTEPVVVEDVKLPEIPEVKVERPAKSETIDDLVSPEVAELLKDEVGPVEEKTVKAPAAPQSEVDKTIELGDLYLNLGHEDEAIDCFRSAASEALKNKEYDKSRDLNKRIAELRPFDLKSRQLLVEIAAAVGDKAMQVEALLNLAESLNRRDAKSEAREVYGKVLSIESDNQLAQEMIAAFERPKDYIDLGEVLRTEIVQDQKTENLQSIDGLISQFRREVFESIGEGDFKSRYDLGVAYKGMGLFQEAIEEFEMAAKDKDLRLKAMEMIGSCFLEKGKIDEALRILNEGLQIAGRPANEYFGIYFLLGGCFEKKKDLKEALRSYMNAYKIDKTVPELTKKINDIKNRLTAQLQKQGKIEQPSTSAPPPQPKAPPAESVKAKKSKITYL